MSLMLPNPKCNIGIIITIIHMVLSVLNSYRGTASVQGKILDF